MAIVLAATGLFVCLHMSADLDSAIDRSLRARAADVRALVAQADTGLRDAGSGADFAQILTAGGRVFDAGAGLGRRPLLSPAQVRSVRAPVYVRLPGPPGTLRIRLAGSGPRWRPDNAPGLWPPRRRSSRASSTTS